jgi:hypothetical protein
MATLLVGEDDMAENRFKNIHDIATKSKAKKIFLHGALLGLV